MAAAGWEDDEWEAINVDGFVYKRKKRPRLDPPTTSAPDPVAEENNRREIKTRALLKLRDKYQKEIDQWEHLSNMLKALQEKAQNQPQLREQATTSTTSLRDSGSPQPTEELSDSSHRRRLDELLVRVEGDEAIIKDISNLCDMAEAICSMQEDQKKEELVNLPIWSSPRELMAGLCDVNSEPDR